MIEEINEPVQAACLFQGGQARPLKFLWGGKEYRVEGVNLAYSRFEGRTKAYFFAVTSQGSFFKLKFDSGSLGWTLLEAQFQ